MGRRKDHSREQLKDMILDAAWHIIGENDSLTARRIAGDIGYAPGTIYNVFPSMEAVYIAVNGRTIDKLYDVLRQKDCNDDTAPPVDNLKQMARLYQQFAKDYRPHWLMLFTHILPDDQTPPDWYLEKIEQLFTPLENQLGRFLKGRNIRKEARILWASVNGLLLLEETGKMPNIAGDTTATVMADDLIDIFLKGVQS